MFRQSKTPVRGPLELSALLGSVFAAMLVRVSGGAATMDLGHHRAAFELLLYGVGLAIVLALFLKETVPAVRRAVS